MSAYHTFTTIWSRLLALPFVLMALICGYISILILYEDDPLYRWLTEVPDSKNDPGGPSGTT